MYDETLSLVRMNIMISINVSENCQGSSIYLLPVFTSYVLQSNVSIYFQC